MKSIVQYVVYLIVRVLLLFVSWLPEKAVFWLSDRMAVLLQHTIQYRKVVIQKNIRNSFPNLSDLQREQLITAYYQHLSDLIIETLQAFRLSKSQLALRFDYQNTDIFLPYLEQGQSIVLMGSHYGNWEMGCLSFPLQVRSPVYTIYKPLSNPYLDQYLKKMRGQWGMNMVTMKRIGRTLVENKNTPSIYIFVSDQSPASLDQAIWKTFLHQKTPFINGVEKIVKRTNFPVFYFAIKQLKRGHYAVTFSELYDGQLPLVAGELTGHYCSHLANQIAITPHQWLWSHNRWKRVAKEREINK